MPFLNVAVPVPGLALLTYRLPSSLPVPERGSRVLVPVGSRLVTGCVTQILENGPDHDVTVKDVADVLDDRAFLPAAVLDLALWVAEYYMAGPGEAVAAALPPLATLESERRYRRTGNLGDAGSPADPVTPDQEGILRALAHGVVRSAPALAGNPVALRQTVAALDALEGRGLVERVLVVRGRPSAFRLRTIASITPAGLGALEAVRDAGSASGGATGLGARQRSVLEALAGAAAGLSTHTLTSLSIDGATVRRLAARGLISLRKERHERDPFEGAGIAVPENRTPTTEQAEALARLGALIDADGFRAVLLHGVTGSGKTEIYVRLAGLTCERGRQSLILVPEIALTPQVVRHFRTAFGDRVAIQHSGLASGERHDQWHRVRRGEVDVVVGTRSAVFAPLERLGLVVVDEEHDTSYKQEESPRYHGRDVAVVRAQRAGALAVLASATPSLESYENAERGRYDRIVLSRRVLDRPLAEVRVVDLREEYAEAGPDVILSRALQDAIAARLEASEQSLLLLNRRGFATAVFCRQCGHVLDCPNCSVSLTVHRRRTGPARALCHYCNYTMSVPAACVRCAAPYLEQSGYGTERVQEEVERLFPAARVARVDRDTMQRRGAVQRILARFAAGELDVLVGTQMIAKGHDFPRVTLVGVVSADMGLGLADFRAAERTFQLLTQVAGRAGRGDRPGLSVVQTIHPDHYSIRLACRQDYTAFFAEERTYRRTMRYPPAVALINVVVRGRSLADAMASATDIASSIRPAGANAFALLGPAPAPIVRIRGEYRAQFFLKGTRRALMREALANALDRTGERRRKVTVDVDPVGML